MLVKTCCYSSLGGVGRSRAVLDALAVPVASVMWGRRHFKQRKASTARLLSTTAACFASVLLFGVLVIAQAALADNRESLDQSAAVGLGARSTGQANPGPAAKPAERPIHRLAQSLFDSTDWDRRDFATIALRELAAEYEQVLERADQDTSKNWKRIRWINAARGQLNELYMMMDDLDFGADFQIFADAPAAVQLVVPPRIALLSSLQAAEPTRLETNVINAYCNAIGCDPKRWGAPRKQAQPTIKSGSNWSLADRMGTTYETVDGLRFMFSNLRDRQEKAQVCERVAADLRELVNLLLALQVRGFDIDWGNLSAVATGGETLTVWLNRSGDGYEVSMPYLSKAPEMIEATRFWLLAKAEGRRRSTFVPGADLLLVRLLR